MPGIETVSVGHLIGSVPVLAIFLLYLYYREKQQRAETHDRDELLDRWWDRHETGEERQRQTIEKLADAVNGLARHLGRETDTLSLLSHEVHTMSATDYPADTEPHLGVPGGRFEPDLTFSATYLQQQGDVAPWTHKAFGIDRLHAKGVRGKGAAVVVIDTGVDGQHPDLAANLDLGRSRSFTGEPLADGNGHGTHCSGIVAADNQGVGTLGVAPDAVVVNGKGLTNQGSGHGGTLGPAIRHMADLPGHRIFSLSFGSAGEDPAIRDAIRYAVGKGHWVCAAAGNSGPGSINWPGAMPEVICVASTDPNGQVSSYSSANDEVDVGMGGRDILSTIPGGRYAQYSGTSMATPGVAGVLALAVGELVKAGKPIPSQAEMVKVLYATCSHPAGRDVYTGYGLVQPAKFIAALLASAGPVTPPPVNPPPVTRVAIPAGAKFIEFVA